MCRISETDAIDAHTDHRVDRRRQTDARIERAVLDLIVEVGPDAITMEAVSASSGVAKTTLYRRYRDRFDLMQSVARQLVPPEVYIEFEPNESGFAELVRNLHHAFDTHLNSAVIGRILASSEQFMNVWRERLAQPRFDAIHEYFERGIANGAFNPNIDYHMLVELIVGGAVIANALRGQLPADWTESVITTLWPLIDRRSPPAPAPTSLNTSSTSPASVCAGSASQPAPPAATRSASRSSKTSRNTPTPSGVSRPRCD